MNNREGAYSVPLEGRNKQWKKKRERKASCGQGSQVCKVNTRNPSVIIDFFPSHAWEFF